MSEVEEKLKEEAPTVIELLEIFKEGDPSWRLCYTTNEVPHRVTVYFDYETILMGVYDVH